MIELNMTRAERDFGIGYNPDKAIKAIMEDEESEIIFAPIEVFVDETVRLKDTVKKYLQTIYDNMHDPELMNLIIDQLEA